MKESVTMRHNRQYNKGFSLIELIVTIAIMAIVTAASVGIFSLISDSNFKEAYKSVTDGLSQARTEKVSKGGKYAMVMKYDTSAGKTTIDVINGYDDSTTPPTYTSSNVIDSKVISKGDYEAIKKDGSGNVKVKSSSVVWIEYTNSGKFKEAYIYDGSKEDINGIYVSYGKHSKTIKLALSTGKFIEN